MDNISLALLTGIDIPIPELQLTIHQPTIKEISYIGEENFLIGISCLCIDKATIILTEGKSLLDDINNFQIFMKLMNNSEFTNKKDIILDTINLILPQYSCSFIANRSMIFTNKNTQLLTYLDESNFHIFQQFIKNIFQNSINKNNYNTNCKEADEIAKKLRRHKERVAKQNGEENSTIGQYLSILTVGLNSMSLNDCMNLTMYQLFDLVERYMLYNSWDMNVRARMAGAKVESQPENWMKSIH